MLNTWPSPTSKPGLMPTTKISKRPREGEVMRSKATLGTCRRACGDVPCFAVTCRPTARVDLAPTPTIPLATASPEGTLLTSLVFTTPTTLMEAPWARRMATIPMDPTSMDPTPTDTAPTDTTPMVGAAAMAATVAMVGLARTRAWATPQEETCTRARLLWWRHGRPFGLPPRSTPMEVADAC